MPDNAILPDTVEAPPDAPAEKKPKGPLFKVGDKVLTKRTVRVKNCGKRLDILSGAIWAVVAVVEKVGRERTPRYRIQTLRWQVVRPEWELMRVMRKN